MSINQQIAAALGFPKLKYVAVERERRWLCRHVPRETILETEAITDLYVEGARLRLREARPTDGRPAILRLTRKADVDSHTRLITSIYLSEEEFALLARSLAGARIRKIRYRVPRTPQGTIAVDEFQDNLQGLILAEAEFDTAEEMAAFPMPELAIREVTSDPRYAGIQLARNGLPQPE